MRPPAGKERTMFFGNAGRKIKACAKIACWIGMIGAIAGGMRLVWLGLSVDPMMVKWQIIPIIDSFLGMETGLTPEMVIGGLIGAGVLLMILGSLSAWIGSFMSCGLGDLIDDSAKRVEELKRRQRYY